MPRRTTKVPFALPETFLTAAELDMAFQTGRLTDAECTQHVPWAWRNRTDTCEVPTERWRTMWAAASYTEDLYPARRPRRALRLFRGATYENRHGLSWTTDLRQAVYFVRYRQAPGADARIWVTVVEPHALRCYLEGMEKEYIVDPLTFPVREVDPNSRQIRRDAWFPPSVAALWWRRTLRD